MRRFMSEPRRAAVLLVILFVMAVTAPMVCLLLEAHSNEIHIVHNQIGANTALYIAEAGLHDACTELLADATWRAGFTNKEFPPGLGHRYTVTVVDAADDLILATSTASTADGYTKTITAMLSGF